jgi:hypothetical protein
MTEADKRLEIEARNELDLALGFGQYAQGPEKLGWLVNIHPVCQRASFNQPRMIF